MQDRDLIEPFAAPKIYCDGMTEFSINNGIFTCVGYCIQEGVKVVSFRMIMPANQLPAAIEGAMRAADSDLIQMVRLAPMHRMMS